MRVLGSGLDGGLIVELMANEVIASRDFLVMMVKNSEERFELEESEALVAIDAVKGGSDGDIGE